ncbi:Uncharacterised protein [Enterobacter hormaechei]|nr:Uncharacterised protein [Enterobacter hormaechei]
MLCRFLLQPLVTFTLSLFRLAALLFSVTVKLVVHQQSHFVVCFDLRGELVIEHLVHHQCFFVHRVPGFFDPDSFLLSFPFGEWAAGLISQLVTGINKSLNFGLSRTHSLFKALQVLTAWLFDCRLAAGHLRCQRGNTVTAFLRGQVRHFVYSLADLLKVRVKAARYVQHWRLLRIDFDDS